ncbi:hypothetical protein [Exiguobacterium alkaliphilum]|uniref:DUF421 domain-containing protein n=1 Tax=Exiguobacterium alkaliphilum TaxID=1428684 RepID=A0ABT2L0B7_9BACL|nr:hypothetical protein [Exiguobacterium alkaliphilum]MCT4796154.1 hypothetical protein [Exiguobacterium alkaliphilum]
MRLLDIDFKKEASTYLKNLAIVCLVAIMLWLGLRPSNFITIPDQRLSQFIDIGVATFFAQLTIMVFKYVYSIFIFNVEVSIVHEHDGNELSSVKLKNKKAREIKLKVKLSGNYKLMPDRLIIPEIKDVVLQMKKTRAVYSIDDNSGLYYIDLKELVTVQRSIEQSKEFPIDIMLDENALTGNASISISCENKSWRQRITSNKFEIKVEGD